MRYRIFGRRTGLRVSELALAPVTRHALGTWGRARGSKKGFRSFTSESAATSSIRPTPINSVSPRSWSVTSSPRIATILLSLPNIRWERLPTDGISRTCNSRKNMMRSVEGSLKRLKTDRIDLYWAHFADGMTPMEEIVRAFDDFVRAGRLITRAFRLPAWRVSRADLLAEMRGWAQIAGIQIEYSLAPRTADRELLPMAEALGLGTALWSPLGGGFLTGKYRSSSEGRINSRLAVLVHTEKTARETAILDTVLAVAKEISASPTEIAIAWLLDKAAKSTTSLIPILGSRTREQLDATLGALEVKLSSEQVARLDAVSAIPLGTPHEQIAGSASAMAGGKPELLEVPVIPAA